MSRWVNKIFYKKYKIEITQRGYLSNIVKAYEFEIELPFYKKLTKEIIKDEVDREVQLKNPKSILYNFNEGEGFRYFYQVRLT